LSEGKAEEVKRDDTETSSLTPQRESSVREGKIGEVGEEESLRRAPQITSFLSSIAARGGQSSFWECERTVRLTLER